MAINFILPNRPTTWRSFETTPPGENPHGARSASPRRAAATPAFNAAANAQMFGGNTTEEILASLFVR